MKKILALILVLSMCVPLIGCSSFEKKVPDRFLIEELERKGHVGSSYTITQVIHNYDNETHIDSVTMMVNIDRKYGIEHITATCEFQYDRASDMWDLYHEMQFYTSLVEYKKEALMGQEWTGDVHIKNWLEELGIWSIRIQNIDFERRVISLQFHASFTRSDTHYEVAENGEYTISADIDGEFCIETDSGYSFIFQINRYFGIRFITIDP